MKGQNQVKNKIGFGKAQKQTRNLKIKIDKRKEERAKELDQVASMDNDKSYAIFKNGKPLLNGTFMNAKFWKLLYGLPLE